MPGTPGYRPAVGIMLLNPAGKVFVARRIDMPRMPAWQMPQGGIDKGENPRQAALRELKEEIGTDKVEILGESRMWLKWFAMRFTGNDTDIDLTTKHPEFDAWKWIQPERLPEVIVPFKRQLYIDILAEFRVHCSAAAA